MFSPFLSTEFCDVKDFMSKMGYTFPDTPRLDLTQDDGYQDADQAEEELHGRIGMLREELREIDDAMDKRDLPGVADGLVDLVYFALGAAAQLGLPWEALWTEVQRANMEKEPGATARSPRDAIKPDDWDAPRIEEVLKDHGWVKP